MLVIKGRTCMATALVLAGIGSILHADPIVLPPAVATQALSIPAGSANGAFSSLGLFQSTSSYSLPDHPGTASNVLASTVLTGGSDPFAGTSISATNFDIFPISAGRLTNLVASNLLAYNFLASGPADTLVPVDLLSSGVASTTTYIGGLSSAGFGFPCKPQDLLPNLHPNDPDCLRGLQP